MAAICCVNMSYSCSRLSFRVEVLGFRAEGFRFRVFVTAFIRSNLWDQDLK